MNALYFCVFADYHRFSAYPIGDEGLAEIMKNAAAHGVQFAIHLGDLCHDANLYADFLAQYNENPYNLPVYHCIGNHEIEGNTPLREVREKYSMPANYYYEDFNGFRLIVLDTNYYINEYGKTVHMPPGHSTPTGTYHLGEKQVEWLQDAIDLSPYPCLLFSHASLELPNGCKDAVAVRQMIKKANEMHPGRVLMCLNGHHHRNNVAVHDGVVFFDVNAVYNGHWQSTKHNGYPEDFANSARMAANVCMHNDPLHAFVRVTPQGEIDIEGMETTYLYDVTPQSIGATTANSFGRKAEPRISSFHQDAVWDV